MINGVGVDILEKERVFTIHKKYGKRFQEREAPKTGLISVLWNTRGFRRLELSFST